MLAELVAAVEVLVAVLAGLDVSLLSGVECVSLVETLARVEKRCAAVRVVAAARAAAGGAHKGRGYPDAAAWLARISGVSDSDARHALSALAALGSCPLTAEALRAGELSLAQAAEITKTAKAVPGSEAELLGVAGSSSLAGLRHAARKKRLEEQDPAKLHRCQRRERYFRHWQDDAGMIRVSGAFTPDVGVALCNRVDTETDRVARAAASASAAADEDKEQEREPWECLAADAVAKLILDGGAAKTTSAELVLVCDISAFQRGHAHRGEVCHVIGAGPVPVSVAWDLAQEAFIKAVLHDGVKIGTVAHYGRHINATLRTALALGNPPDFDGAVCAEAGCDRRYHLEWDHVDPVAHNGATRFDNLQPRCRPCHREKTRRDRQAGLLDPQTVGSNRPAGPDPDGGPAPP